MNLDFGKKGGGHAGADFHRRRGGQGGGKGIDREGCARTVLIFFVGRREKSHPKKRGEDTVFRGRASLLIGPGRDCDRIGIGGGA